jgi:hypothetical protein
MAYLISEYSKNKAEGLGVKIKPSTVKGKKIDVYKNSRKVASVGALGYSDYPTYVKSHGKAHAGVRRKAYKQRHSSHRGKVGTPSFYADQLLW